MGTTGFRNMDQRFYASTYGRFNTPDPAGALSGDATDPTTWNQYAYTGGDPINGNDPNGLCDVVIGGITQSSKNSDVEGYAASINAISVYPYSSSSSVIVGVLDVWAQALGPSSSTYAAVAGLALAAKDGAPINVTTFSGGAAAFTAAVNFLNSQGDAGQAITSMINSITYVAPGATGQQLYGNGNVTIIGGGGLNSVVAAGTLPPADGNFNLLTDTSHCGHSFGCLTDEFPAYLTVGDPCSKPVIINQPPKSFWAPNYNLATGRFNAMDLIPSLLKNQSQRYLP